VYSVGDKVVCASHGAGSIVGIERKEVFGSLRDYITLQIRHNCLTVMIPVENAERRLRRVVSADAIDGVFEVLRGRPATATSKWHDRLKGVREKLGTGNVLDVAEVVRDFAARSADKGLPLSEKQLAAKAQKILVSELMYACDVSEGEASTLLEEALAGRVKGAALAGGERRIEC
jgi:CarD family transcriptional regulator